MFDIFIKPTTLHIDCLTSSQKMYNYTPIQYSSKFFPEWWKKLPKELLDTNNIPRPTMKTCTGFLSVYKNSIIIPCWEDMIFSTSQTEIRCGSASNSVKFDYHAYEQRSGYLKNFHHTKIISPWLFKCKHDINFSWQKPMYNFENPIDFVLMDGVVSYKYQHETHINLLFRKTLKTVKLEFLQPLVLLTPHTEKRLIVKNHLVSEQEMRQTNNRVIKYINGYNAIKKLTDEKNRKKCPFHF
jgi:hypothetical protein